MASERPASGYLAGNLPYNRTGHGPRPLVVFQGLLFANRPQPAMAVKMYDFLGEEYTNYMVLRRPGLPRGYIMRDMAGDYAEMIRAEFGGPVDLIGVSTGGSIAQQFAADHPGLVRRLVIHSSAYALSEPARRLQLEVARLAEQGKWRAAYAVMFKPMLPSQGLMAPLGAALAWLGSSIISLSSPKDPTDLLVTIAAEDQFNFRDRLVEITAPALVVAGDRDPFYNPALFRETAAGIPGARLILYPGMGHPASGKQFARDVLDFLREDR